MSGVGKDAYLAMLSRRDAKVRQLLEQGFDFVTNAFKAGAVPSGFRAKQDRDIARQLTREGYLVELSAAYDEQGNPRPTMSAIWRRKA